jgi:hypothetical protein
MTKVIVLGVITRDDDETLAFPTIPLDMDPAAITAMIEAAELAKREAAAQESLRLRQLFLDEQAGQ